ncbi:MAG: hypothetical protein COW32_09475 [Candidatus Aquicultor secundus]|uniref:DUF2680 domain-containing protein n=1 Tax=Candidatus Aquicultor secundus TaxID=1973895 RepID=A0A2M7T612_9ACTN|nr:hypothetical protein [Candidatus Aquicultor secundus]NCO65753.1 hypothetical protein [Solirubrobacter sp.]OIO84885.1 MAG: hypothetical protein AUK32_08125 [Candidatus Aquicultor secundus]PIU26489.1 MAG: hypothetical protein COT10_08385 [Candidatus Aquicultor secundus]PIW21540.1 MAG: hypothetical protein COW32_09475 [Candidatus Aquicultor secundus]PIX52637.1 MAG: hypothetical protein COZ51_03130 [Candidatus Aquicultor secundus]
MDLKKKLLIGFLVVGVALTAVAGISFAASGAKADGARRAFASGCCGVFDSLSETLGLKPDQVIEKRNNGESLADMAKEQNVSQEAIMNAILKDRKKILDQRVKAGQITAGEEAALLERMETRIRLGMNHKAGGPGLCVRGASKPDQHGPRSGVCAPGAGCGNNCNGGATGGTGINATVQGPY